MTLAFHRSLSQRSKIKLKAEDQDEDAREEKKTECPGRVEVYSWSRRISRGYQSSFIVAWDSSWLLGGNFSLSGQVLCGEKIKGFGANPYGP